jgi:hypothetical protein
MAMIPGFQHKQTTLSLYTPQVQTNLEATKNRALAGPHEFQLFWEISDTRIVCSSSLQLDAAS